MAFTCATDMARTTRTSRPDNNRLSLSVNPFGIAAYLVINPIVVTSSSTFCR